LLHLPLELLCLLYQLVIFLLCFVELALHNVFVVAPVGVGHVSGFELELQLLDSCLQLL
jgi:hypothetical protein